MTTQTPTPRTDAEEELMGGLWFVLSGFARTLERELAEAQRELARVMIDESLPTGHGDSIMDLARELRAGLRERAARAERLEAAEKFADYAAQRMVEQFCTAKRRGVWDYGICGPLVSPAFDYLNARGRLEYIGNGKVRITEGQK